MGTTALEIWVVEIDLIWCFWSRSKGASLMRCLSLHCGGALWPWPPRGSLKQLFEEVQQLLHCFLGRKEVKRKSCFPFQERELFPSPLPAAQGEWDEGQCWHMNSPFPWLFSVLLQPHIPLSHPECFQFPRNFCSGCWDQLWVDAAASAWRSEGTRSPTLI